MSSQLCADVSVGFEASEYSVLEGEGVVEVCAEMVGQLDTTVAVFFSVPEPPATQQGNHNVHNTSYPPVASMCRCKMRQLQ